MWSRVGGGQYQVDLSEADARRYRAAFFKAYPGVLAWHDRIRRDKATEMRTLAGRRRCFRADDFYGAKANHVIQGTGGDGLKEALALLWERRDQCPGAFPILAVHDEIVVEAPEGRAQEAARWLWRAMMDGMRPLLDSVRVLVKVTRPAKTWGG